MSRRCSCHKMIANPPASSGVPSFPRSAEYTISVFLFLGKKKKKDRLSASQPEKCTRPLANAVMDLCFDKWNNLRPKCLERNRAHKSHAGLLSRFSCVQLFATWFVDHSPPGSSVHGIAQARILEWVSIPFSKGSSGPRDRTHITLVSCSSRWVLFH